MAWLQAISDWSAWMRAANRPQTTRRLREYQLRRFSEAQPRGPWGVTTDMMVCWLAAQDWSPETRKSFRSALRSFYSWAATSGRIDQDPSAQLPPVRIPSRPPRPTPESLLIRALVAAEPRVQLMIVLAARCGLRRAEIACVHERDLTEDLAGWSLLVHGKGGKDRTVPLMELTADQLRDRGPGWIFPGRTDGHLSAGHVGRLVGRALGTPGWTTHTLRHRFATVSYAGSRDLLAVQMLLGHASSETTRQYVRLPDDALRATMSWAA